MGMRSRLVNHQGCPFRRVELQRGLSSDAVALTVDGINQG